MKTMTLTKTLFVALVGNQPKGLFSETQLQNYSGKRWWDDMKKVEVPLEDYEKEKINVSNIKYYIKD